MVSVGFSARILREFLNYSIRAAYPAHFILCVFLGGVLLPRYFVRHCIYSLHVRFSVCASCKTIETGNFLRCYSASRNDALASHFGADSARSISGAISKSVAVTNIRGWLLFGLGRGKILYYQAGFWPLLYRKFWALFSWAKQIVVRHSLLNHFLYFCIVNGIPCALSRESVHNSKY